MAKAATRPAAKAKAKPTAKAKRAAVNRNAPARTKPAPKATVDWWNVVASREVLGGTGACRVIEPRGYSELSTNPQGPNFDFRALGGLPCLTGLYIRNPANGKSVGAVKQDKGAGSSFHPVMGLYPQTLADLGLDVHGGEFHVQIRRQDGHPLRPAHGTQVKQGGGAEPAPTMAPQRQEYFNPLKHAKVKGERVDQGVDYSGTGYLTAIADGVVSYVSGQAWQPYGNYLEYKITQRGELEGAYVYYAEGINPVVHEGEAITGGSRLCDLISGWRYGIEIGFAAGNGHAWTYYRYHDGPYREGTSTRPGIAFNNLIRRLGGPVGIVQPEVVGSFPEYMQSGEPAPGVTLQPTIGDSGTTGIPVTDPSQAAQAYDFGDSFHSAFIQVQRGSVQAHSHSRAARVWAQKQTYLKKSD